MTIEELKEKIVDILEGHTYEIEDGSRDRHYPYGILWPEENEKLIEDLTNLVKHYAKEKNEK